MNKTLCMMLLAALPASAQHLSPDQSLSRAIDAGSSRNVKAGVSSAPYQLVEQRSALYVFRNNSNNSLLITSADERMRPVLARIEEPGLGQMPPAMEWLLEQYEAEAAELPVEVTSVLDAYASWTAIKPLVKTKWNQGAPYNAMCPDGTSTGCVATAMAQILYTNKYAKGKGAVEYIDYSYTPHEVKFDFENAKFDFDAMTNTYSNNSSQSAKDAVAELMFACGAAVNTTYGSESSATPDDIPPGLINHLGYDEDYTHVISRHTCQSREWETIIYNELQSGRPLLYGGSTPKGGGHAFVVDGYSDNGLFHINWGWGGISDGYFALSALNPYSQGIGSSEGGFNINQYVVVITKPGAENPQEIDVVDDILTPADKTGWKVVDFSTGGDLVVGSTATISFKLLNVGEVDFNDNIHVGIFDEKDTEISYAEFARKLVAVGDVARISVDLLIDGEKELVMKPGKHTIKLQDHWRRSIDEVEVMVYDPEDVSESRWSSEGLSFYVTNLEEFDGSAVIGNKKWEHTPKLENFVQQDVDFKLVFFERDTDNVVATFAGFSQNLGMYFNQSYNWGNNAPRISGLDPGVYDMCYTANGSQCSPRISVRVGATVNKMSFAPLLSNPAKVSLEPASYKSALTVPEKVTVGDKEYTVASISPETFHGLKVTSVDLPATIENIDIHAFRFTNSMRHLVFRSQNPPFIHSAMFTYGMHYSAVAYAPAGSLEAYDKVFVSHPVYALMESITGPVGVVKADEGATVDVELTVTPVSERINPEFVPLDAAAGVEILESKLADDGKLVVTLKVSDQAGRRDVLLTPAQPGVEPVALALQVGDEAAISEISLEEVERESIYDLSGRKLSKPVRGINIINGHKIIVK